MARVPSPHGLEKRPFSLFHLRASLGSQSYSPSRATSQSSRIFALFVALAFALAHCPCFAHFCHDPFIVRSTQTCSTVPSLHSACASGSMFTTLKTVCSCIGSLCTYRGCSLHQIHHGLRQPSSSSGVWDPWPIEYQSCKLVMLLQY